jgi:hypothetical protein
LTAGHGALWLMTNEYFSTNFFGGTGVSPVQRRLKPAAPKTSIWIQLGLNSPGSEEE